MAVPKRLRYEIFRRDKNTCKGCGRTPEEDGVKLTVDHVVPAALGGGDEPRNLQTLCMDCNAGKSSVPADAPIVAEVAADADRWASAMREVARRRAQEHSDRQALLQWFYDEWNCWRDGYGRTYDADGVATSIPAFLEAGLSKDDLIELVEVAMRSKSVTKWKYFCGCCWNRIRKVQELAAELVAPPVVEPVALTTVWTASELTQHMDRSQLVASRYLDQESVDSAYCRHREWGGGTCGDPVCLMQRAEAIGWMADAGILQSLRDDEVIDAAAEAEDYIYG